MISQSELFPQYRVSEMQFVYSLAPPQASAPPSQRAGSASSESGAGSGEINHGSERGWYKLYGADHARCFLVFNSGRLLGSLARARSCTCALARARAPLGGREGAHSEGSLTHSRFFPPVCSLTAQAVTVERSMRAAVHASTPRHTPPRCLRSWSTVRLPGTSTPSPLPPRTPRTPSRRGC